MNKVLGIALAGAALYGLVRILRMQNVSDLTTLSLVNPRVNPVTLAGLLKRGTSNVLSNQGLWYTSL